MELSLEQRRAIALAQARRRSQEPTRSSAIFPVSRYGDDYRLDLDAGVTGFLRGVGRRAQGIMQGEIPLTDEAGRPNPEVSEFGFDVASIVTPVNPAIRAGSRAIPGAGRALERPDIAPPTRQQLRDVASQQYRDFRDIDAEYSLSDIQRMAQEASVGLNQRGFNPRNAPQTFGIINEISSIPTGGIVSPNEIQTMRQSLGRAARPSIQYPEDAAAASEALSRFDEFVTAYGGTASPAHRQAAQTLQEANQNWGAMRRSDVATGIEDAAGLRSSAANSGQNTGNAIRQRVASALISGRPLRGFNATERAELRRIVEGTLAQNTSRDIGNLLGGGGGLGGITATTIGGGVGATVGGAPGAMIGAAGTAATGRILKVISNRLTENALRSADEQIRRRSPLYQQMLRQTPMEGRSPEQRMAIVRIMMALELGGQQEQRQSLEGGGFR